MKSVRPGNPLARLWEIVSFKIYWRWAMWLNFSHQDMKAAGPITAYHEESYERGANCSQQ